MKLLIAGSRTISNYNIIRGLIFQTFWNWKKTYEDIECIISGGAIGVDTAAELFAKKQNIQFKLYKPDWQKFGKSAGYIRNKQMVNEADALIAIWDGQSKGTMHTVELAKKKKIPFIIHKVCV